MPPDPDLWSHKNISDIIWYLDPDQIAHYFATLVEHEKDIDSTNINSLFDLIDPDTCPEEYLTHLASVIGVRLYHEDRVETWRSQIRSAVRWYKEKGKISSFTILFHTMGMNPEIYPLWINERGNVEREPLDPSYKPHARIDLVIREYPEWQRYLPENLQFVLNRMEEVRPIHVLLRGIFLGWDFFDVYPFNLIEDELEGIVQGSLRDYWCSAYYGSCGIWHHPEDVGIYRDGGGYSWQYPRALEYIATPPLTPTEGDRYLVGAGATGAWAGEDHKIADYSSGSWSFSIPALNDAIWVEHPPVPAPHPVNNPGGYKAYFFNGTTWYHEWNLFEQRRRPGPYFRECNGPLAQGGCGPVDEHEVTTTWTPAPDPWGYCLFHDGYIQLRNGTHMHNCREFADTVFVEQTIFSEDIFPDINEAAQEVVGVISHEDPFGSSSYWDLGEWDDPDREWDAFIDDELEINIIPVIP